MKNGICLILPFAGKFHNYFELFLHSVYKNKDILDVLILIPDSSTPEIKTEVTFKIPENVFIKKINFIEALQLFENKLSEIFQTKISLQENQFNLVKNPYTFCHYRGFLNLICKPFLENYSHWGFVDCDLILGNFKEMLPDALTLDCQARFGHLSFFKNQELPREAFGPICDFSTSLYEKAYDFFVNKKNMSFAGDETWAIRTITNFFNKQKNSKIGKQDYPKIHCTPYGNEMEFLGKCGNIISDTNIDCFEYHDGNVYALIKIEKVPLLYAHFMKRTKFCNNTIKFDNFSDSIYYKVTPPLTFNSL